MCDEASKLGLVNATFSSKSCYRLPRQCVDSTATNKTNFPRCVSCRFRDEPDPALTGLFPWFKAFGPKKPLSALHIEIDFFRPARRNLKFFRSVAVLSRNNLLFSLY
jgi:hypothetical protein